MVPRPRHPALAWLPVLLWMAAIFCLSSIPRPKLPQTPFPNFDKVAHTVAYAVGGVLTARATASTLVALAIPCAFGFSDEWHQRSVPGRDSSGADWAADCLGALIGVALRRARRPRGQDGLLNNKPKS
jgi:VanZ family protein